MKRFNFLFEDHLNNDQSLEVDVMRFVAIIGIIFWIIFAMIKSIPFTHDPQKTIETIQDLVSIIEPLTENISAPESVQEDRPQILVNEPLKGLHFQFQSLEDLITMLNNNKVKIYCRAVNKGFDLIFEGYLSGDVLEFKSATDIPKKMWELKNGADREYFIRELGRTISDVKSFNRLQVMVLFSDSRIDSKVETMLSELNQEKKNGILSVSSSGQIKFHEFK
ncbi:MAG: hypothetical protein HOJ48_13600 [Desulfobacula sp.]|jgi:hypothetical protein|nr:hypothetical protein [Deltaproteobacteria bacterium]MBT6340321.1 hypothetical protein [Desulfobacula sp.]